VLSVSFRETYTIVCYCELQSRLEGRREPYQLFRCELMGGTGYHTLERDSQILRVGDGLESCCFSV
jgi:hypothetical protein